MMDYDEKVERGIARSTSFSSQGPILERPSYALLLPHWCKFASSPASVSTCAATTPGGARAAAVVHGVIAVVLGKRGLQRRPDLSDPRAAVCPPLRIMCLLC